MTFDQISGFKAFHHGLVQAGFSLITDNDEGIFSLCEYFTDAISWHTGNEDTDPWSYRIRLITEYNNISYGKVFFKKSGYITREWLPTFVKLRRKALTAEELYEGGLISKFDYEVYRHLSSNKSATPLQLQAVFGKEQKKAIAKTLVELQMKLLVTTLGETHKISSKGEPYGWPIAVFTTVDHKFGYEVQEQAEALTRDQAYEQLVGQIMALNPNAQERRIKAFIKEMK